jgi:hypothetical protein
MFLPVILGDACHPERSPRMSFRGAKRRGIHVLRSAATKDLSLQEGILRFAQDDSFAVGFLASLGMTEGERSSE